MAYEIRDDEGLIGRVPKLSSKYIRYKKSKKFWENLEKIKKRE